MKILTYFIAFFIAAFVNTIIKEMDIAYSLAVWLVPDDVSRMALLAGAINGILSCIPLGFAYYFAGKINRNREVKKFIKAAQAASMSEFEYAKSITPEKVISYCDSHLDRPVYTVTGKLDKLADDKVISRPCADALIKGYTELMEQTAKNSQV